MTCRHLALAALLLVHVLLSTAAADPGKVLVLLDDLSMQQSHSNFLAGLKARGYDVTVASVDAKSVKLREWEDWLFDKLVLLGGSNSESAIPTCTLAPLARPAPSPWASPPCPAELTGGLRPSVITDFFDAGHDVLLALAPDSPTQLRTLAQDLGVGVSPAGTVVIDHFNFEPTLGGDDHAAVLASELAPLAAVFSKTTKGPVLFRGVGLAIPATSEVAFPALTATDTSYVSKPGEVVTGIPTAGAAVTLVALVQGRHNNARAAVLGSTAMLSNQYFAAAPGNAPFAADVSRWAFSERGVLRASALRHGVVGGEQGPAVYRVNDDVKVELDIVECSQGKCGPYRSVVPFLGGKDAELLMGATIVVNCGVGFVGRDVMMT